MVVYPADYNRNATEIVDDSAQISMNTFKVVFAHFHPLAFYMKYQMDVNFYKGACHFGIILSPFRGFVLIIALLNRGCTPACVLSPFQGFVLIFDLLYRVRTPACVLLPSKGVIYTLHLFSWGK